MTTSVIWGNLTNEILSKRSQIYERIPLILLRTGKINLKVRMEVTLGGVSGTTGKGTKKLLITGLHADSVLFLDPCLELSVMKIH